MADTLIPSETNGQAVPSPEEAPLPEPRADATKEYVAGAANLQLAAYIRALPPYTDDLTRDFGDDIYDRMSLDGQVDSSLTTLVLTALADGWDVTPAVEEDDPEYELAVEVRDFCWREVTGLEQPFDLWLFETTHAACRFGHKVSEKVAAIVPDGPDKGKLMLRALKVKPRRTTAFVVNAFMDVVGLLALIPGESASLAVGSLVGQLGEEGGAPNLLPREKFSILTINPKDGDPRGNSLLRSSYDPWWRKQQTKAEHLKFLAQTAGASLVMICAPDAQSQVPTDALGNPTGGPVVTPEQQMVAIGQLLRNGTVVGLPNGADAKFLHTGSDGGAFLRAMDGQDREIAQAILFQTLATMEGQHQARAASETHQDVLDTVVRHLRTQICAMVQRDLFRTSVEYNFGADVARRLTPWLTLGGTPQQDWAKDASGVSALVVSGFLDPSQYMALDERLGLPVREKAPEPAPPPPQPGEGSPPPSGKGETPPAGDKTGEPPPDKTPSEPPPEFSRVDEADVRKARIVWRSLETP